VFAGDRLPTLAVTVAEGRVDFLLSDDQKKLQDTVAEFARAEIAPRAEALDREARFPVELYVKLGEMGILAIPFEEKWGGLGLAALDAVIAIEEIARADQSLAVSAMVSMATGLTLSRFGTERQKQRYLPDIVAGRKICALAGTEPDAGSDTAGFKTTARRAADGGWRMNGQKAFITNSGTAITSFALVLAVTSPPAAQRKSFTLFAVPAGTEGFAVGEAYRKMGWRSSDTHPLFFADCELTDDDVVGEVDKGRIILHRGYQQARLFLAACSVGLAQASLDHAVAYAKERQAFGGSLGRLQLIQDMVARICVKVDAARLLVYKAAWLIDRGEGALKELATAKYYATEIGSECADLAIQVHGGAGFMDDCPVSRFYRDNRVCTIGDGSSQIQLLLIARELGLDVRF
jgi:alkylation response protein AidB-like acyl-CoA dehydrogenase